MPRWRPVAAALRSGELASVDAPKEPRLVGDLVAAEVAFTVSPGVYTAADLLAQATTVNQRTEITERAAQLLLESGQTPPAARLVATWHLEGRIIDDRSPVVAGQSELRTRIRRMRAIVRTEPTNSLRWVDLALAHANVGQRDEAVREMGVALALSPNNRHVLRSASRLFVLAGEPDRAHAALVSSDIIKVDPWVKAAELSVASVAQLPARSVRSGTRLVRNASVDPWHLSELAGELATLELRSGNLKRARQLMRVSLIQPTENAVAQAQWADNSGMEGIADDATQVPGSFEAQAIQLAASGKFDQSIANALLWQADQPFAPEPAIFAAYLASIATEDYKLAISVARQGLITNPDVKILRNNLAFALILDGQIAAARSEVDLLLSSDPDSMDLGTITATAGLLAFRTGQADVGRRLYERSGTILGRLRNPHARALSHLFWAREELRSHTTEAPRVLREALARASSTDDPGVKMWAERLSKLDDNVGRP